MNSAIELDFWLRLLGILALGISLVIALAFAAQAFTQSTFWRRAIWQSCFVCLLLLLASEFSGAGRGIAIWFAGKPMVERKVSVRILPADESFVPAPIENKIPPLMEFSERPVPVVRSVWWPGILWLAGSALIAARILFARILFLTLRWRRRGIIDATLHNRVSELALHLGIRREIHLLESPGFSSPMTFGIAQPCIALPKNFSENFNAAEQNAMLTHELAHVAARDPFWYLLADVASALLWWHPLIWLARRRLHAASELAADEAAAILENGPGTLAECLVNLGQRMTKSRSFGWLGVDGNGFRSHLGQRVERLLNLKPAKNNKLRGWPSFVAKTAFTIFFGGLIVFTSGWIQNGKAPREKDFTSAVQNSWNASFASTALAALAVEREESPANEPQANGNAAKTPHYDEVTFDTLIFENVPLEKLNDVLDGPDFNGYEPTLRRMFGVTWLSSNELPKALAALSTFKELMVATNDMVGSKASGVPIIYQGNPTNRESACNYFSETKDGLSVVTRAEMSYRTTNVWRFSVVPQKQPDATELKLFWTDDGKQTSTQFRMPTGGGAIVQHRCPDDPSNVQLIVFSSVRAFTKEGADEKRKITTATLVQDGKLLFEIGKLEEAEIRMNEALKIDAENKAAFYYKTLIKEARFGRSRSRIELMRPTIPLTTLDKTVVETRQVPPSNSNPTSRTNLVHTTKGRQMIKAKLDRIRLKEVRFESLPLGEVLKTLTAELKEQDPEHVGINFLFNPHPIAPVVSINDPTASVFTPASSSPAGLDGIKIHISPTQHDVRLADVLDLIVGASEQRLDYKIEDYAVVFSPKPKTLALYTRVFKLDGSRFLEELKHRFPDEAGDIDAERSQGAFTIPRVTDPQIGSPLPLRKSPQAIGPLIRKFFTEAGVDFVNGPPENPEPNGKSVFFKERAGLLMVRATEKDLEIIGTLIEGLSESSSSAGRQHSNNQQDKSKARSIHPTLPARAAQNAAVSPVSASHDSNSTNLYTRVFKVYPRVIEENLREVAPGKANSPARNEADHQKKINETLRDYFQAAGVTFGAPGNTNRKSVFFSETKGLLMVRATMQDLEIIETAVEVLNFEPPQVVIEAKFVEVDEAAMKKLGLNWLTQNGMVALTNQTASDVFLFGTNVTKTNIVAAESSDKPLPAVAGIFTDAQYQAVLKKLESAGGTDILAAPKVTTLSGRRNRILTMDAHTIVNGPGLPPSVNTNIFSTNGYWSENIFTGPMLDVTPTVSSDSFSIRMALKGIVIEFLGYGEGDHFPFKPTASPNPRLRVRTIRSDVNVWDGQTVMLALEDQSPVAPKRKSLFVFVTATIIDPAGNRVHSDEEMPFATNSVPKQPGEK